MLNVFYKDKSEYHNQLNPLQGYLDQITTYISLKQSIPVNQAKQKAIQLIKTHFKDKEIKYFERQENGDRVVKDGSLYKYINDNLKAKNILVPTFTSYVNEAVEESILSEYTRMNVKKRSIAKKAGQKAKAEGNEELAAAKNNEQNTLKSYNNSLSGAFAQIACVLYNPTAHSTLTSITRTITSLSNAGNEKLIEGNRYYPRQEDVLNNLIYIATYAKLEPIKEAIEYFSLYIPTVEDTVKVLQRSSDLYFVDQPFYQNKIIPLLSKMSSYQLAAICYCGDLYHIRIYNDQFMRTFISKMIQPVLKEDRRPEIVDEIYTFDEAMLYYVHYVLSDHVKGRGKDYAKMLEDGVAGYVYHTYKQVEQVILEYQKLFQAFFMTELFPGNSHRLSHMKRRAVVLSDTDSTCYTLDKWAEWYKGSFMVNSETIAIAGCIALIAAQSIINQLAILSKHMNIAGDKLNTLAMKSEFLWLEFTPTEVSKHYFALTAVQEGNVFSKPELEVKGVHLKNSAVPKFVIQDARNLMEYISTEISNNRKIKLNKILSDIIKLENNIKESVYRGEPVYLKKSKIKSADAYALEGIKSPYARHLLWKEVFSEAYGDIQDPPYDVIKIPTTIVSPTALKEWVDSIEDKALQARLISWLERNEKKNLPTVYLNEIQVLGYGIPKEILSIIDIKRIIFDTTKQHRMIVESLGVMLYTDLLIQEQFNELV